MNEPKTIDAEVIPPQAQTQALAVRQDTGAVGRAMTIDELHANLEFVRTVMRREMKEGQDYGKIPGCGDKPSLLQPGAQKLLMTFNLTEHVRKEEVRDFPGLHREYAFTICVSAPNGKEWDGVGTCSTLEAKYRYRKAERKCPKCGHSSIIPESPKFLKPGQVAGWLCWKKKGGCGATFAQKDPAIAGQEGGKTENPDPAECWNTVRKMAFKRALVSAAINATNTSELWTQDIEDMRGEPPEPPANEPEPPRQPTARSQDTTQDPPKPPAKPASPPRPIPLPTVESRAKMITALVANPGNPNRELVTEYFLKCENPSQLMPGEPLESLPLRFVPSTTGQMRALADRIAGFGNGEPAAAAFPPNNMATDFPDTKGAAAPRQKPPEVPRNPTPVAPAAPPSAPAKHKDPEWWRDVIVPIPPKGVKRDEYLKAPQTIGQLYDARHGQDEESQAGRQRLWGFVNHFEPKPWVGRDGQERPPNAVDVKFREALDAFWAYFEREHPEEKL